MGRKLLTFFNVRTFLVLLISQLAAFLVIRYQIKFQIDLVLFGVALGFPLAFSIQAAFRRRERALEYSSLFKSSTMALYNSFRIANDLLPDQKVEIRSILIAIPEQLFQQIEKREGSYKPMQEAIDKVFERNRENLSNRNVLRMIRYVREIMESSTYLVSLVRYRTMIGPRFYAIAFIFIFPIIQAPIIYYRIGDMVPWWAFCLVLALGGLILVTLNNFQTMIEYPLDAKGVDNIQVRDFGFESFPDSTVHKM
jgi:hypothetical protein